MPENFLSQKNIIIIIAIVFVVLVGGGYYFFTSSSSETESGQVEINTSLIGKDVVAFLSAKNRINLKESSFLKSVLYSELVDYSENIPMSTARGRDNPFMPYVAPRSIR